MDSGETEEGDEDEAPDDVDDTHNRLARMDIADTHQTPSDHFMTHHTTILPPSSTAHDDNPWD